MTTLFFDEYVWKCKNCKKAISLPGVVPSLKGLQGKGWNFCPFCGEMINYRYCEGRDEIVHCSDCRYYGYKDMTNVDGFCYCLKRHEYPNPDWFCADGQRREENG